jgi:hypothetical protein
MMEVMNDINWQTEIKLIGENTIRERKKQRTLAKTQERWKDQVSNERDASEMIGDDRDDRKADTSHSSYYPLYLYRRSNTGYLTLR